MFKTASLSSIYKYSYNFFWHTTPCGLHQGITQHLSGIKFFINMGLYERTIASLLICFFTGNLRMKRYTYNVEIDMVVCTMSIPVSLIRLNQIKSNLTFKKIDTYLSLISYSTLQIIDIVITSNTARQSNQALFTNCRKQVLQQLLMNNPLNLGGECD